MAMVKFLCPNGHPLNSPPHLVGKAGKCPKCGTAFIVPAPDDENTEESTPESGGSGHDLRPGSSPSQVKGGSKVNANTAAAEESELAPAESVSAASQSSVNKVSASQSSPSTKPKVEMFYFLCPNGHKLHGPVTLKGRLGQCPHCGSKFHVPEDEPEEEEQVPAEEEPEYHSVDETDEFELPEEESYEHQPEEVVDAEVLDLPPDPEDEENAGPSEAFKHYHAPELDQPEFAHPLAQILAKLWAAKSDEGEVELTLDNNTKFIPDYYSPQLSKRDFAVFATFDGVSYTVHSFAWKSIRHCTMNKIDDLPPGMFEGKVI